jgi:hypothetical protein
LLHDLADKLFPVLLLHNILVTDKVMQQDSASYNYRERYDPSVGAPDPFDVEVQQPADLQIMQNAPAGERRTVIGINNAPPTVQTAMTRSDRLAELNDLAENRRLHKPLMDKFNVE